MHNKSTGTGEKATASHRASRRAKLLWGSGAVADALMTNTVGVLYLPIYSLGFGINTTLLGFVMFIPRLWDMFTDPIMGNISDNTRTRWGRRRPYLPVGGLLAGLFFFLMWIPGPDWSDPVKLGFFLVCLLLFYTAYTVFVIPWNGLGLELSDDYADRTSVQGYRIFMAMLATFFYTFSYKFCFDFTPAIGQNIDKVAASLLDGGGRSVWSQLDWMGNWVYHQVLVALRPVVEAFFEAYFSIFPDRRQIQKAELNGVAFVGALFGCVMLVFTFVPAWFVRERKSVQLDEQKTGFVEAVRTVLADKNLLSLGSAIFGIFLGFVSTQALTLFINTYYVFADLPIEEAKAAAGTMGGKVGIVYTLVGLASIPLISLYTRLVGKRIAIVTGLGIVCTGCISSLFLFTPHHPHLQLFLAVFYAGGLNTVWINSNSMVADICDMDESRTGRRRQGVYGATLAWISKLGFAVALLLSGLVVDLTGIDPALVLRQDESTIMRMRLMYAIAPAVCLAFSMVFAWRYKLSESEVRRTRATLDARAASAGGTASGAMDS